MGNWVMCQIIRTACLEPKLLHRRFTYWLLFYYTIKSFPHFPMYSWLRTLLSQGYIGHMHTWDTRFFVDLWAWQYIENMRLSRAFSHDIEHISTAHLHDRERRKGTATISGSQSIEDHWNKSTKHRMTNIFLIANATL